MFGLGAEQDQPVRARLDELDAARLVVERQFAAVSGVPVVGIVDRRHPAMVLAAQAVSVTGVAHALVVDRELGLEPACPDVCRRVEDLHRGVHELDDGGERRAALARGQPQDPVPPDGGVVETVPSDAGRLQDLGLVEGERFGPDGLGARRSEESVEDHFPTRAEAVQGVGGRQGGQGRSEHGALEPVVGTKGARIGDVRPSAGKGAGQRRPWYLVPRVRGGPTADSDETLAGTGGTPAGYGGQGDAAPRAVGSVVAEDYRIEGRLGAGGMGVVYLARHTKLDRQVAIKELMSTDPEGVERLGREAMAMARLDHPNVVRVFDARLLDDRLFIAMEYLAGGTLRQWCEQPRPHREILDVFARAAQGLAAAHAEGIVHRDFKPDNVMLTRDGHPKVGDFGIARGWADAERTSTLGPEASAHLGTDLTRTGALMGTPAYMAPEQYERQADPHSDQFAFCVSLYEALYRQRPFEGRTPAELWVQASEGHVRPPPESSVVPRRVFEVLRRGLRADPLRRFGDVEQLLRALRRASSSPLELMVSLGVAALLAVTLVSALAWVLWGRDADPEPPRATAAFAAPAVLLAEDVPSVEPDVPEDGVARPDLGAPAEDGIERRPMPGPPPTGYNPPGYRTFDGPFPFKCVNERAWFVGAKVESTDADPLIVAGEGCDLRCSGCSLRGVSILAAADSATVEISNSRLYAEDTAIMASGQASVRLTGVGVEMGPVGAAVSVTAEAKVSLYDMDLEAQVPIDASGDSTIILQNVLLIGQQAVLRATRNVTVKDEGGVRAFVGGRPTQLP